MKILDGKIDFFSIQDPTYNVHVYLKARMSRFKYLQYLIQQFPISPQYLCNTRYVKIQSIFRTYEFPLHGTTEWLEFHRTFIRGAFHAMQNFLGNFNAGRARLTRGNSPHPVAGSFPRARTRTFKFEIDREIDGSRERGRRSRKRRSQHDFRFADKQRATLRKRFRAKTLVTGYRRFSRVVFTSRFRFLVSSVAPGVHSIRPRSTVIFRDFADHRTE